MYIILFQSIYLPTHIDSHTHTHTYIYIYIYIYIYGEMVDFGKSEKKIKILKSRQLNEPTTDNKFNISFFIGNRLQQNENRFFLKTNFYSNDRLWGLDLFEESIYLSYFHRSTNQYNCFYLFLFFFLSHSHSLSPFSHSMDHLWS